jgi:cation:H+ antiporter
MVVLVLLVSLATVTLGAEALVRGASVLALRAGVSALFVGLTVVGFGTSAPELMASLTATLRGSTDISVGNVVGSNIFNVGMILGLTATIRPVRVALHAVRRDLLVAIAACAVPFLSLLAGGRLSEAMGVGLIAVLVSYLVVAYRSGRTAERGESELALSEVRSTLDLEPAEVRFRDRTAVSLGMVVVGLAMLVVGSRFFVGSAIEIAHTMGVSDLLIGLTIVSVGTSLPELMTALVATKRHNPDIAIGNVLGSNIFNLLGILGVCAVAEPQVVPPGILWIHAPVMFVASCALLPLIKTGGCVSRREGAVLVLGYVAYVVLLVARGA